MYLDANFFIYAALDKEEQGKIARNVIKKLEEGKMLCATSCLAFDEAIWIIRKKKGVKAATVAWMNLLEIPNLKILSIDERVALRVPYFMEKYDLKPRDAIHAAVMMENAISEIVSSDSDFDKVKEFKRIDLNGLM